MEGSQKLRDCFLVSCDCLDFRVASYCPCEMPTRLPSKCDRIVVSQPSISIDIPISMKSIRIITLALCLGAFALPTASFAAKEKKGNKPGKVVREYDANANGTIDGAEIEAVRKAFDADKTGALKQFDTDSDGKLSDTEIAAMKAGHKRRRTSKPRQQLNNHCRGGAVQAPSRLCFGKVRRG